MPGSDIAMASLGMLSDRKPVFLLAYSKSNTVTVHDKATINDMASPVCEIISPVPMLSRQGLTMLRL